MLLTFKNTVFTNKDIAKYIHKNIKVIKLVGFQKSYQWQVLNYDFQFLVTFGLSQ